MLLHDLSNLLDQCTHWQSTFPNESLSERPQANIQAHNSQQGSPFYLWLAKEFVSGPCAVPFDPIS